MAPENPVEHRDGEVARTHAAAMVPLHVSSYSRLGLVANPPGFRRSLGDWLRRR